MEGLKSKQLVILGWDFTLDPMPLVNSLHALFYYAT